MMTRFLSVLRLLLVMELLLTACGQPPATPAVIVAGHTPLPTWTLPFGPSATPTPRPQTTPGAPGATSAPATPTPTARPGIDPTLGATTPDPFSLPVTPIPEPMPQLFLDKDIVNILLVGRDTARDSQSYRTDVMIVVSINKAANSVTLLTLPRDLFVYIPGWTMNRLNTAAVHGDLIHYPGGGMALLEQTILYNFGLPIHGWVRIDFAGFKEVIDLLEGVDVPVSCAMQDWRLKNPYDPAVDVQNADNWELYTVPPGVQHMDGDLALWYARSRKHSSDFDRSRRQHQVLRAMLVKALQLKMLLKVPDLYQQYIKIVDTDLTVGDALQFAPLAASLDRARIKSRFVGRDQVWSWTTPQGAAVLLPDRAAISALLAEALQPPYQTTAAPSRPSVEVWNGTPNGDWTALAADNLAWDGISPAVGKADRTDYATTTLIDYSTTPPGALRAELQRLFNLPGANVISAPDPKAAYPFRVILGADYNACVQPAQSIHATPTPGPGAAPPLAEDQIVHAARVLQPPPTVDGDLTEWTALVYPVNQPSFNPQNWQGADDASASWNIAWDDRYLYLAAKVKDNRLVSPPSGEALFKGDSLELWVSVDPGARTDRPTEREFQLGISPGDWGAGKIAPEAYLWMPNVYKGPVKDALIAARPVAGGYTIEVAVPWSVFRMTPFAGEGLGFTLALNDDDQPGTALQEKQVTNVKDAHLLDPRTWGVLTLDPPPGP